MFVFRFICVHSSTQRALLTQRVILALGSVDLSVLVDPQEKLLEGEQLPPPHVPLEVVVAAHVPTLRPPGPAQVTPGGPGPGDDLGLRNVQRHPVSPWAGEPQPVSAVLVACRAGQGGGQKQQRHQEWQERRGGE